MISELKQDFTEKSNQIIKQLENEYTQIIASGAHPAILHAVQIEYYGELQPLKNIANISALDFETLIVTPYDPEYTKEIAKIISKSNLNLNPIIDENRVKMHIPRVTAERREELAKMAKTHFEDKKIRVRNLRQEINKKIKSNKELSENEQEIYLKDIQKLVEETNKKLEDIYKKKEHALASI